MTPSLNLSGLVWARPEALLLLLLLPVIAGAGLLFGRGKRNFRRGAILWRLAVAALLVIGLAEPMLASSTGAGGVVFAVDRSASVDDNGAAAVQRWLNDALATAPGDRRAAIVSFGARPLLTAPPGAARTLTDTGAPADIDPAYTDISAGLALARALPLGGGQRVVLISDGAENIGSAATEAAQAAAAGAPIDVVAAPGVSAADLRVDGLSGPASAWEGEPIAILVGIETGQPGPATVELVVDGVVTSTESVDLEAGLNSREFSLTDLAPGFHAVTVRVQGDSAANRNAGDDAMPLGVVVRDKPHLLLIAPEGSDAGIMRDILQRGGAEVTVTTPVDVPSRLSELGAWDGFVLDNVPAPALSYDQTTGLREATRQLGRGLIVIGGTSSYGPGAYAGTPLEEALPVTVKVTDGRERQRVALLLIMDKSGSMGYDPANGLGKIELAKEAARLAAGALSPGDQIGVLAFNDHQEWLVPMTTIEGPSTLNRINRQIDSLEPDGGTEILPALSVGLDAIRNADADARHIVLLSDGKARTGSRESYQRLLDDVLADRTTLSTIAMGEDADTDLLNFLADEGAGRYHFTVKAEDIPLLTLQEARSAGSQSVIRGSFQPIQTAPSPILTGVDPTTLPALAGYDFAEAKPDAQVVLASDREDPILAKWQYGLGRVVAWTADDGSDLAASWANWAGNDAFWAAAVRWALPDPERRPLTVATERSGADVVLTVSATGAAQDAPESYPTFATVRDAEGNTIAAQALSPSAPGEYTLRLPAPAAGAYAVEVRQERPDGAITELASATVPPSPENLPDPNAAATLQGIAARTGGRVLSLDDPGAVWDAPPPAGGELREHRAVWYVPIGLALLLFLGDIAARMGIWHALRALPRTLRR
ncbi:MAG: VWA domain-containing protein [Thermomicrobiales bacterium]